MIIAKGTHPPTGRFLQVQTNHNCNNKIDKSYQRTILTYIYIYIYIYKEKTQKHIRQLLKHRNKHMTKKIEHILKVTKQQNKTTIF